MHNWATVNIQTGLTLPLMKFEADLYHDKADTIHLGNGISELAKLCDVSSFANQLVGQKDNGQSVTSSQ